MLLGVVGPCGSSARGGKGLVMGSMHGSGGCEGAWSAVVIRQI
jgi:hypothetical protein